MKPAIYVVDTQALVWFTKGLPRVMGLNAYVALTHPRARIVIPSYVLEEIQRKFEPRTKSNKTIKIPPTALLRLLYQCSNVRILPRGGALLAREFRLQQKARKGSEVVSAQDIPIAAAVLTVRDYYDGPIVLVTADGKLRRWSLANGVPVVWNQVPFLFLPQ